MPDDLTFLHFIIKSIQAAFIITFHVSSSSGRLSFLIFRIVVYPEKKNTYLLEK